MESDSLSHLIDRRFELMKNIIIFFAILAVSSAYSQQGTIRGIFEDRDEKKGVPLAELELMSSDSAMIDVAFTDLEGNFSFRKIPFGDYILKFSCFGYKDNYLNIRFITKEELILETVHIRTLAAKEAELKAAAEAEAARLEVIKYRVPLISKD